MTLKNYYIKQILYKNYLNKQNQNYIKNIQILIKWKMKKKSYKNKLAIYKMKTKTFNKSLKIKKLNINHNFLKLNIELVFQKDSKSKNIQDQ